MVGSVFSLYRRRGASTAVRFKRWNADGICCCSFLIRFVFLRCYASPRLPLYIRRHATLPGLAKSQGCCWCWRHRVLFLSSFKPFACVEVAIALFIFVFLVLSEPAWAGAFCEREKKAEDYVFSKPPLLFSFFLFLSLLEERLLGTKQQQPKRRILQGELEAGSDCSMRTILRVFELPQQSMQTAVLSRQHNRYGREEHHRVVAVPSVARSFNSACEASR